ncbi:hypothetical protein [Vibrio diazotrophicus]|uniref:hypothetical protein n=1 Tax=Vibrio diazotrophicus TaxID=685 RepID=UPI000C9E1652|nr:hypothetical protein [Vibrio diazotrophicus]PNH81357.1 hypothetical protein C1N27_07375 [Vibrio diazotrophicus]
MANNIKARPSDLISLKAANTQQVKKCEALTTNNLYKYVQYLDKLALDESESAANRKGAIKLLCDLKKDFTHILNPELQEAHKEAQEEAARAIEEERDKVPVIVDTPESIAAAKAKARALFEAMNNEEA